MTSNSEIHVSWFDWRKFVFILAIHMHGIMKSMCHDLIESIDTCHDLMCHLTDTSNCTLKCKIQTSNCILWNSVVHDYMCGMVVPFKSPFLESKPILSEGLGKQATFVFGFFTQKKKSIWVTCILFYYLTLCNSHW